MSTKTETAEKKVKIDLLDPLYPLLSSFKDKCPGTFKHSQTIVEMVEAVGQNLGLENVHQLKVAAMYHDIGKIVNPNFFSENQRDENPHDEIQDPWISSQIISRHVSDGTLILINDHEFSRNIIEIISQHHGNTILKQFFKKSNDKDNSNWRYPGPKPACIESAVLLICDGIEAQSQSVFQSHKELNIKDLVESRINILLDDGQLDDVVMRLGDLKLIKEALVKDLEGIFPKRVDYDEEEPKNSKETK